MKKKLLKSFILTMPLLFALTACEEKPENNIENKDEINVVTKYNVTFDSDGGNNVDSQELEENGILLQTGSNRFSGDFTANSRFRTIRGCLCIREIRI